MKNKKLTENMLRLHSPKLYAFLKKKDALKKFVANCNRKKCDGSSTCEYMDYYDHWLHESLVGELEMDAQFVFYRTPEGHRFWQDLNDEYNIKTL